MRHGQTRYLIKKTCFLREASVMGRSVKMIMKKEHLDLTKEATRSFRKTKSIVIGQDGAWGWGVEESVVQKACEKRFHSRTQEIHNYFSFCSQGEHAVFCFSLYNCCGSGIVSSFIGLSVPVYRPFSWSCPTLKLNIVIPSWNYDRNIFFNNGFLLSSEKPRFNKVE